MNNKTRLQIVEAFENFDKWETYGTVFDLMTQRKCTLRDIQEIAAAVTGQTPGVIAMRRRDILGMSGGLEAHRRELRREADIDAELEDAAWLK